MSVRRNKFRLLSMLVLLAPLSSNAQWGQPPDVVTDSADLRLLAPSVEVPGTVISRHDARLASELNAKLKWIAEVGTEVTEGDTIARLEDFTYKIQEMEAQSRVDREQANVTFLESELQRLQRLSLQNLSAKSQLDQTTADLAIAKSDHKIAQAQLGYAQIAMHITQIRAPFDGIVTERLRNIGERLNISDEVIRLVDPADLEVVARAPLSSVNFIGKGDVLHISNEFRSADALIRTIVPFGDPQSHMFEVRLDVSAEFWTVGESVRLSMPTAESQEVLAVPRDALVLRREGAAIFKIGDESTVSKINVTIGLGAGTHIEVFGEIDAGDQIVVRGAEGLSDGMTVNILEGVR